jgi:putative ABC transport system permease protein
MLSRFIHDPVALGAAQAAVAAALVLAVAMLARVQGIHLERETIVALARGLGQIFLFGFLLAGMLRGPAVLGVFVLAIMIVAAGSIGADRARYVPGARPAAAFGTALGSVVVIVVMTAAGVIDVKVASLVPVGSMIINGAMNTSAQTLERFGADVLAHTGQIEAALALGAPPPDSVVTFTRSAVSASLIPSVNSMRSLGIVWIPGLMAGMLLTGSDPVYAAIYQFVVVAMIYAAAGLAALGTVSVARRRIFSSAEQLILRPTLAGEGAGR